MLVDDPNLIALAILPGSWRADTVLFNPISSRQEEMEARIGEVLAHMSGQELVVLAHKSFVQARKWIDDCRTRDGRSKRRKVTAAVVAIVSFRRFSRPFNSKKDEVKGKLLDAGLPVVFVVDNDGKAVAHPMKGSPIPNDP